MRAATATGGSGSDTDRGSAGDGERASGTLTVAMTAAGGNGGRAARGRPDQLQGGVHPHRRQRLTKGFTPTSSPGSPTRLQAGGRGVRRRRRPVQSRPCTPSTTSTGRMTRRCRPEAPRRGHRRRQAVGLSCCAPNLRARPVRSAGRSTGPALGRPREPDDPARRAGASPDEARHPRGEVVERFTFVKQQLVQASLS